MKTDFYPLDWHDLAIKPILATHRRGGLMVLCGRSQAGKRRFLSNLRLIKDVAQVDGSIKVWTALPRGTDREILLRLARGLGIAECGDTDVRSDLLIQERIEECLPEQSTLIINDAHRLSVELLRTLMHIRNSVGDQGKSFGLVLATSYSANYFQLRGINSEEVSHVFEIPELGPNEMLDCIGTLAGKLAESLQEGVANNDERALELNNYLAARNLGWFGLIEEFCDRAVVDFPGQQILDSATSIIAAMDNPARPMKRYEIGDTQAMLPFK